MRPFGYASPVSIAEAFAMLEADGQGQGDVRPLAGGTDLLTLIKADLATPSWLVDIKRIDELDDRIVDLPDGLEIGALTTLAQLETSALIPERYAALAEAAAAAASPQLRNMATIGGNLLQRPRCWYFRNPHVDCWLKGGDDCPARDGENQLHALFGADPCVAVHPSDLATALVALDAEVRLRGPQGERLLSIEDFFAPPTAERRTETVIGGDELIVSIRLPDLPANTRSTYLKAMDRKVWAFALVSVAVTVRLDGQRVDDARIVLGGVAPVPHRAHAAERMLTDSEIDDELVARVASAALEGATPLANNGYKIPLAEALVRNALAAVTGDKDRVA